MFVARITSYYIIIVGLAIILLLAILLGRLLCLFLHLVMHCTWLSPCLACCPPAIFSSILGHLGSIVSFFLLLLVYYCLSLPFAIFIAILIDSYGLSCIRHSWYSVLAHSACIIHRYCILFCM